MQTLPLSETDLRYWLANEDIYFSRHTRDWLARTPREEAVATLARIAADAAPEPPLNPWGAFTKLFIMAGFTPASAIAGGGAHDRKSGTRAALLLAYLKDPHSIEPLARTWTDNPRRQSQYQDMIESYLARYLEEADPAEVRPHADTLLDLANRIWNSGPSGRDLPASSADLLHAALNQLHRADALSARPLLETITSATASGRNRQRIQEAARALLVTG